MSTDSKSKQKPAKTTKVVEEGKPRERSPNHPMLTIQDAIEKAKLLQGKYGRVPVAIALACQNWGYGNPRSGGALQSLAALKAFGLIEISGRSDMQKAAVTEAAERIIRGAPDRDVLLKNAAISPQMHKEVWDHFDKSLPHDDVVRNYLLWERPENSRFTHDAVDGFIERLRSTLGYARLTPGDGAAEGENNYGQLDSPKNGNGPEALRREARVGSFVQWTSNGADQFPKPRKIVGIDGNWAFMEGSPTGLPMQQLTVVDPPAAETSFGTPPPNPYFKAQEVEQPDPGSDEERANLPEGPVMLKWPKKLSKHSLEELDYWLKGILRQARRKAGLGPEEKSEETSA